MARKLAVNVAVGDKMYGPDFPENGELPADAKVGDHVFEPGDEDGDDGQPVKRVVHSTKKQ